MHPKKAEGANPQLLRLARITMGLTPSVAASRIGLRSSKSQSSTEKLLAFEKGIAVPTKTQLMNMAHVYHRPLLYFYFEKPPSVVYTGIDFRTSSSRNSVEQNALLQCLIRDMHARQGIVEALLDDEVESELLPFIGSLSPADSIKDAVKFIQELLSYNGLTQDDRKFGHLRSKVEDASVFVILAGNLGSYHTNIDESVFRGFVLANPVAPFIVINEHDALHAQAFTLLHELVHLCLGQSGVSGPPLTRKSNGTGNDGIEQFCNDVASEFLLPSKELDSTPRITVLNDALAVVKKIALHNAVSEPLVAYRLWRSNLIDREIHTQLSISYGERWRQTKASKRQAKKLKDGGPSYNVVKRHRLGASLVSTVNRWYKAGEITAVKAGKVLGVKAISVDRLLASG